MTAAIPALRREVLVNADPARAFHVFTSRIGEWWPLGDFSVYGARGSIRFLDPGLGARIVEFPPEGQDSHEDGTAVWGTVTRWEPPGALGFTWHPGRSADQASQVSVTFEPAGEQTLVRLEHSGWEVFDDPAAARGEYDHGWEQVLGAYAGRADAS